MIDAKFKNVTPAITRSIVPVGSRIPLWSKYEVTLTIPEQGTAWINVGGNYEFGMLTADAMEALVTLQNM